MKKLRQECIETLLLEDTTFKRYHEQHRDLDRALKALDKKVYLTVEEQAEINHLKKLKLQRKDEMEAMLVAYESGITASQNRKRSTGNGRAAHRS